tara:strand:+ start:39 stop:455 length:417 start_codon:yes stop_codon:yes gene_type:complete
MKSTIGKVIYLGILPAMGTYMLLFSMFHVELGHLYNKVMLSSESDTAFKLVGIIMCTLTWFAAFQYWNLFVREYSVQMTEEEYDSCSVDLEELEHQAWLDSQESQEHWDEEESYDYDPCNSKKVQLDSYYKDVIEEVD